VEETKRWAGETKRWAEFDKRVRLEEVNLY
jgi:hypothetical protein